MEEKYTINPRYLRYGNAKKAFSEMTMEEIKEASKDIIRRAKEKAFIMAVVLFIKRMGIPSRNMPEEKWKL